MKRPTAHEHTTRLLHPQMSGLPEELQALATDAHTRERQFRRNARGSEALIEQGRREAYCDAVLRVERAQRYMLDTLDRIATALEKLAQ